VELLRRAAEAVVISSERAPAPYSMNPAPAQPVIRRQTPSTAPQPVLAPASRGLEVNIPPRDGCVVRLPPRRRIPGLLTVEVPQPRWPGYARVLTPRSAGLHDDSASTIFAVFILHKTNPCHPDSIMGSSGHTISWTRSRCKRFEYTTRLRTVSNRFLMRQLPYRLLTGR